MKVAMFTNNYKPFVGGVPISIERLADGLRNRGHVVDIFAPTYENQVPEEGVYRFKSTTKSLKGGVVVPDIFDKNIKDTFATGGYDVIHSHHPMAMGHAALYLSKKYDVPLAYTYHTRYEAYLHYLMPHVLGKAKRSTVAYKTAAQVVSAHNRFFANKCDMVFAPTQEIKDILLQDKVTSTVEVLPTGLASEDFAWDKARAKEIKEKLACDHVFCCVSRLEKEKNFSFMLRGLAKLKEQWKSSFKMLIIGDGTEKDTLMQQAKELDLQEQVVFIGQVAHDELVNYYRASELFLFTSQSETQGIVLLEGMAAGLPVVAVEGSGVNDIVKNGENGFKTMLDENQWADKIQQLMEKPMLLAALQTGASHTAQQYSETVVAQKAEAHYEYMLQEVQHVPFRYEIG